MGGYYRTESTAAAQLIDSAPCLASLQPSPADAGRAVTALLGPDRHSLPAIYEVMDSFAGGRSTAVYRSVVSAIGACPALHFAFGGSVASVPLAGFSIPAVGDADRVWSGSFASGGTSFEVQVGVVLDATTVLTMVWVDSVPPSAAIMGSFDSTVSLAIGKLA